MLHETCNQFIYFISAYITFFQLFNISVFASLKHILIKKSDATFRYNFKYILQIDEISMFIHVEFIVFVSKSIFADGKMLD